MQPGQGAKQYTSGERRGEEGPGGWVNHKIPRAREGAPAERTVVKAQPARMGSWQDLWLEELGG